MRILSVIHWVWSFVLLLIAAWLAASAIRILPYLSTGTPWTNLPRALLLAAMLACLPGALATWMALLGRWTWRGHPNLRAMLLVTHGFLLVPGIGAIAIGIITLRAAQNSAARGGGLMGGLGDIPLAAGICLSGVAAVSIAATLLRRPHPERDGPG